MLLSGELTTKLTLEALESGANAVLQKPLSVPKLSEQVRRIIASLSPVCEFRHEAPVDRYRLAHIL